jgi:hypothetical protein
MAMSMAAAGKADRSRPTEMLAASVDAARAHESEWVETDQETPGKTRLAERRRPLGRDPHSFDRLAGARAGRGRPRPYTCRLSRSETIRPGQRQHSCCHNDNSAPAVIPLRVAVGDQPAPAVGVLMLEHPSIM